MFGPTKTFVMHIAALGFVASFSFIGSYLLFKITDWFIPLRVSDRDELDGLDLSQHGESLMESASTRSEEPQTYIHINEGATA